MNKSLFFIGSILMTAMSFAQQRTILAESYSQASCPPCAVQNPAFEALLNANASKIIAIKYQVSFPGYDPMYLQNPTEINSRRSYYEINSVPDRVQDGTNADITQSTIDTRSAVASPINMTVSHVVNADLATANVTVTITAPAIWNPSATVLRLAMVEKSIVFATAPGTNGEKEFHNVMRKMVPNPDGTPVDASKFTSANGTQTFTFTNVAIPSYIYNLNEVGFIAWVQNNTTKEVYQAGKSNPIALGNYGITNGVAVADHFTCDNSLANATVSLKNQGTNAITSATVNYQIDNGTVQTTPFTGNLAAGASTTVTLPTISNIASGSHVLKSYLTNINNSGTTTQFGAASREFARISSAGTGTMVTQDFTSTAFPYADYSLYSATAKNWVRDNTSKSMKFAGYDYPVGAVGTVTLAPFDMKAMTNKTLTFKVAYRALNFTTQAGEVVTIDTDGLNVLVSKDCGANWTTVYSKTAADLVTGTPVTNSFKPAAADWRYETIDLSAYANDTKVFIQFEGVSDFGNNIYVDNVNIGTASVNSLEETASFSIYPNPASEKVTVNFTAANTDCVVKLTDLTGKVLISNNYSNLNGTQAIELPLNNIATGNYLVTVTTNNATSVQQISVK